MKCIFALSLISSISFGSSAFGQTNSFALNAAGGSNTIASNTYEWSIGEMTLVNTVTTSNLIVTHGLLQPMFSDVGISPDKKQEANFSVFPNPTNDKVFIQLHLPAQTNLGISVFDITGRQLMQKTILLASGMEQQEIDFSAFVAGIYFMSIRSIKNNHDVVNNFKIEKK